MAYYGEPVTVTRESSAAGGTVLTKHAIGRGPFEVVALSVEFGPDEEAMCRIYFEYKDSNNVLQYQFLGSGYGKGPYMPVTLDYRPIVVGPGDLYCGAEVISAAAYDFTVTYRRVIQ